jgi:hypothetical protein
MNLVYRTAIPADTKDCIRLRGLTRENAVSKDRLATLGITAESWAKDFQDGASPGFVCIQAGEMAGYCFGSVGETHHTGASIFRIFLVTIARNLSMSNSDSIRT